MTDRRALLSAFDKTDLVPFAKTLHDWGYELVSTGGTARCLQSADLPVTMIEEVTGFPEMLDGRVKTLHPRVHGGILADRRNPDHLRQLEAQNISPFTMVVVSLYPFAEVIARPDTSFDEAIEMIDIGGPCMVRAAAKNHANVTVVTGAHQYDLVRKLLSAHNGEIPAAERRRLATEAFRLTAAYDGIVATYLARETAADDAPDGPTTIDLAPHRPMPPLRYGENPHQRATAYECPPAGFRLVRQPGAEVDLSYNNLVDADAAAALCADVSLSLGIEHTCVFVKHTNACGVGTSADAVEAYRRAYLGDPNAAMGGVLSCAFAVTREFAEVVMATFDRWGRDAGAGGFFTEVWIAPGFDDDAVAFIAGAKNWGRRVRLLQCPMEDVLADRRAEIKRVHGGYLAQDVDRLAVETDGMRVVTKRQPTPEQRRDLDLAWLVAKHTKSNAISLCRDGMLLGSGAGQMSRVTSCRLATWLAETNAHELKGAVAASDAFFPFADGPEILADAGIAALIQPGGSKRDEDTVSLCDARGLSMIFTGTRHFRH